MSKVQLAESSEQRTMSAETETGASINWDLYRQRIKGFEPVQASGRVTQVVGLVVESEGPAAHLGDICYIYNRGAAGSVLAEVVGFKQQLLLLMPLGELGRISQGSRVVNSHRALTVPVGRSLLGRVIDPLGTPIDGLGPVDSQKRYPVHRTPPAAMH